MLGDSIIVGGKLFSWMTSLIFICNDGATKEKERKSKEIYSLYLETAK